MKKHLISALTIVSLILLCAFSSLQSPKQKSTTLRWWDFNGTSTVEMGYNIFYSPDPDNWPDCPPQVGNIYCEIYAAEDTDSDPEDPKPDLSTISNYRMKLQ